MFGGVLVGGAGGAVDEGDALAQALAKAEAADLQLLDAVFGAHGAGGIVDGAVVELDMGAAAFAGAAQAETNFVVVERAVGDERIDVFLEVEGGGVGDLGGLVPAVHDAIAHDQLTAGAVGLGLGVDGVFAGALAGFEPGGVGGQRAGPERAVLDAQRTGRTAVGVELDAIARDVGDVAIADDEVAPAAADAVGVVLLGKGLAEHVVDAAIGDEDVGGKDADAVAAAAADFAMADDDVFGGDLDEVAAGVAAFDQIIFVQAGLGDFEAGDFFGLGGETDLAMRAQGRLTLGGGNENKEQRADNGLAHIGA